MCNTAQAATVGGYLQSARRRIAPFLPIIAVRCIPARGRNPIARGPALMYCHSPAGGCNVAEHRRKVGELSAAVAAFGFACWEFYTALSFVATAADCFRSIADNAKLPVFGAKSRTVLAGAMLTVQQDLKARSADGITAGAKLFHPGADHHRADD